MAVHVVRLKKGYAVRVTTDREWNMLRHMMANSIQGITAEDHAFTGREESIFERWQKRGIAGPLEINEDRRKK
jgi:hypothetical protein